MCSRKSFLPPMAASALLLLLGLSALTACAATPRPPAFQTMTVAIPETVAAHCTRSERPETPAAGSLDVAPVADPSALTLPQLQAAFQSLWAAYVARGRWIVSLSNFSAAQEGDVAACDATRETAVGMLGDVNAANAALPPPNRGKP